MFVTWVGPKSSASVFIRDKIEDTDTLREEVLVKMETEIGVTRP